MRFIRLGEDTLYLVGLCVGSVGCHATVEAGTPGEKPICLSLGTLQMNQYDQLLERAL